MKDFKYLKTYFSPFKPLKPKFYIGKTAIGTPYFYPRKWVKATPKLAREAALDEIERAKQFNERNKNNGFIHKLPDYEVAYERALRCSYPKNKKKRYLFILKKNFFRIQISKLAIYMYIYIYIYMYIYIYIYIISFLFYL
jgi:hypothetical protein